MFSRTSSAGAFWGRKLIRGLLIGLVADGHTPKAVGSVLLLALVAGLAVLSGCRGEGPTWRAHRANERGILQDQRGRHAAAVPHYERSLGFGIDPQIPTYNQARSHAESEHFSTAHELNQRALELEPELVEAYFNDGVVLFRWGRSERDPRGCELARTVDLWRQAEERFRVAAQLAEPGSELAATDRRAASGGG